MIISIWKHHDQNKAALNNNVKVLEKNGKVLYSFFARNTLSNIVYIILKLSGDVLQ